jgi:hypothetical protein
MKKVHREAISVGCKESKKKIPMLLGKILLRSLTKGLRMGLINEVYMNENSPLSPQASSKSKFLYLKSLSDPMRSTIGMTYPMVSSLGFQVQEENVKNGKRYALYKHGEVTRAI